MTAPTLETYPKFLSDMLSALNTTALLSKKEGWLLKRPKRPVSLSWLKKVWEPLLSLARLFVILNWARFTCD